MRANKALRRVAILSLAGTLLSACSTEVSIPTATTHGVAGHRFSISFLKRPKVLIVVHGTVALGQYGTSVDKRWAWSGGGVYVFVDDLARSVPSRLVNPLLRRFLPNTHGGKIVTRFGFPAVTESVPCSSPAGTCAGTIGSLVVLDGSTLYDVFVHNSNPSVTSAVIDSFRLAS
jgi:hypothetical protein